MSIARTDLRRGAVLLAAALSACSPRLAPTAEQPSPARPSPAMCRVGPDGGPLVSDRGIGGTGAPVSGSAVADRGIGGTGAPTQFAERGLGGTGIIGVVTGFASV